MLTRTHWLAVFFLVVTTGCSPMGEDGLSGGGSSNLATVRSGGLPAQTAFGANGARIKQIAIKVEASGASCQNGTKGEFTYDYGTVQAQNQFSLSLAKKCDYTATMSLREGAGTDFYSGVTQIPAATLDQQNPTVTFTLARTPAGEAAAMPLNMATTQPPTGPIPEPGPGPAPGPVPGPGPAPGPTAAVHENLKFPVVSWAKSEKGEREGLESHLKGKIVGIDFSSIGCPGCVQLGGYIAGAEFKAVIENPNCSFVTLLPGSENAIQFEQAVRKSGVRQHTFAVDDQRAIATKFGYRLSGIPAVITVDIASGKMIAQETGSVSKFEAECAKVK